MFDIPYAVQLGAVAAELESGAAAVRERYVQLGTATARCGWDGDAARSFRSAAHDTFARMRLAATQLDDAAEALRRHAMAVGRAVDERAHETARALHRLGLGS